MFFDVSKFTDGDVRYAARCENENDINVTEVI